MADFYLVTTEDVQDGMWFDDPREFNSEREAREFAAKRQPPENHCFGIYRCELVTMVRDLVGNAREAS
jgi:hypothetical protein